ncbi:primary-amine oxidase [Leptolyngbya sp. FACHB-261]|uniref:primary-amine oxidase n=1 Tax=Leptolyngbya sp. FACHB-261 TaxID=2692806 RepID=UPI0016843075|nr:primary-amine oxidase [Leptolyngbya sp. FACHB-261]MBD2102558.1 primary-amine oxidase [Leptolyngbya sp. FACHB-261]
MTIARELPQTISASISIQHPLDPLTPEEITAAVSVVRKAKSLSDRVRFATVTLQEPDKSLVLNFQAGDSIEREAFLVILDNTTGSTYEAIVSLSTSAVVSWEVIPNVQPSILLDEFIECEQAVKASPEFQAALAKRGITDPDLVMVDPWSAGNFGMTDEQGQRLSRALCWVRSSPTDNGYARPIEGVIPVVDLNTMTVLRVEDYGVVQLPPEAGNYTTEFVQDLRPDLKPLEIVQPQGPSFEIDGYQVRWQKWQFRIGFTPREGLVLYTLGYEDQGRLRPILYRASLAEMVVPYGDPRPHHFRKNAFDVGEYGVGTLANSLTLGCDCLGEIRYFDAFMTDSRGQAVTIKNAVCLHEEDYGILWKHMDWRTNQTEVRRSRRLVVSFIATVGNYEYGFFWYLYQDASIQYEVKLTGIVNTTSMEPGETSKYGTLIAPQLNAPIHQHFFNVRLDMSVDGESNSVYEVNTEAEPMGPDNPYGNAFFAKSTLLETEQEAQRVIEPMTGRYWKIVNPSVHNRLGQAVAYKLVPGENILPFARPESSLLKRAAFTTKHLWVTPYQLQERFPAGDYPNQHPGGEGLPAWTQANRAIADTDVVVWYSFGHLHVPRPEDWPVMPTSYVGFMLKPVGFFEASPALDVPPSAPKHKSCCD